MAETRKLAAILCSDVVGYSRLAGADEDRILARLRALRSDLIDPTIAVHNGRVVKRTGDGLIIEFRSVVDAVRCAIEVQSAMVERNAGVPEDRRIVFRIGIHLGDVVEESDGDLMGDGVNIAARLEGVAAPGAICLSEDAYRQVKGRLELAVTDLGPTQLKNIAEPVRAYSLQVGVPAVAKPAPAAIVPTTLLRPAGASSMLVPKLIADAGENASLRFLDFFTANIRNPNTRAAYAIAVRAFFTWLDAKHVAPLAAVRTHHVSAYVEFLSRRYRAPTVKQHLAAIRMLFDWLIVGQIFAGPNPAAAVRGPKHVVKKGKTSVLDGDEAKKLIDSIDVSTIVGLRDRALIALLVYTFARVSAPLHMNVEDYYPQGKRWWVRLHEKGGKQHEMPAHHLLEHYLDAYVTAAGIGADKASPLFRTLGGRGRKQLGEARMARQDARRMIVRRALAAGIATKLGCHTFRATGITVYLLNGGLLEYAQQMAAHESARTTKLYDRRNDQVTLDQVERIVL